MVNKDQVVTGLVKYIDNEVMPYLATSGKWILGSAVTLSMQNIDDIYNSICQNQYLKLLKIVDQNGMIDSYKMTQALKENAQKYGKLQMSLPLIGTLTFSDQDIDKLRQYIEGVNYGS